MCSFLIKESSSVRIFSLQCIISKTETPQVVDLKNLRGGRRYFFQISFETPSKSSPHRPVREGRYITFNFERVDAHARTHTILHKL
jgi:hypothetical protein